MYCKYCGNEIANDSIFCSYCGKNLTENKEVKPEIQTYKPESYSQENVNEYNGAASLFKAFFIIVIVIATLAALVFGIYKLSVNSDSKGNIVNKLVERDITKNDYVVSTSQGLTSYAIIITPNRNIKYCDVQCTLYDRNDKRIYSDTISKTDLIKNKTYSYNFDFGFTNSLSGSYIKYNITGKCI